MGTFKIDKIEDNITQKKGSLVSQQWKKISISFNEIEEATDLWGARAIEWSITTDINKVMGQKDAVVINETYNRQYAGSITVLQSEISYWYTNSKFTFGEKGTLRNNSLVDFAPFDIIIRTPESYCKLNGCRFTNDGRSYSQSDAEPEITLTLSISGIEIEKA